MIRFAEVNEIEDINRLGVVFESNFLKTYHIKDYLNNPNYIILVNEDDIINGLLIVYKNIDYFELEAIVVDPDYRKRGIGNSLINFFVDNYVNLEDIFLEVAVNNINAINLYKKNGFEIINIRKKYYKDIDAYVMKRVVK